MFVNHLCDRIPKKYDVLIERFDLTLQLDAVDEVNRYRHMLPTQGVEKWVLQ
jgi:hypothetical protein